MPAVFYVGDAISVMNRLPEKSVDLILTSPPFLALRSYLPQDHKDKALEGGSQSTPGEYVDWLLDVVEACTRVLAPHGSLVFELGDTHSGSGGAGGDYGKKCPNQSCNDGLDTGSFPKGAADCRTCHGSGRVEEGIRSGQQPYDGSSARGRSLVPGGDPSWRKGPTTFSGANTRSGSGTGWPLAKSLSLIPETFRFAMVYGRNPHTGRTTPPWRLRNVIRWVRPNPPVGALGDKFRPATSELMVFCKAKDRFFDLDSVRVPYSEDMQRLISGRWTRGSERESDQDEQIGSDWTNRKGFVGKDAGGAPPLDWWNIPPGGYPGAHYAVWPPELLIKPIKAMCPEKVCRVCGEPSRRIVRTDNDLTKQSLGQYLKSAREAKGLTVKTLATHFPSASGGVTGCVWNWENKANTPTPDQWSTLKGLLDLDDRFDDLIYNDRSLVEYEPESGPGKGTDHLPEGVNPAGRGFEWHEARRSLKDSGFSDCGHDDWRPGLILDPFAGSGTTLAVATGHGRDAIGIDLDERNFELALERVGPFILTRATESPPD